jgi:hypothetical protein
MFYQLFGVSSAYQVDDYIFYSVWTVLTLGGMWRVFSKAGLHGWGAVVPIYNVYLLLKITRRPGNWLLLLFVPIVNIALLLRLAVDLATAFGRSVGFGVIGLFLFPFVGYPILGLGKASFINEP